MFHAYLYLLLAIGLLALVLVAVRKVGEEDSRNLVASVLGVADQPLRMVRDRLRSWGEALKATAGRVWAGATAGRFGAHPVWAGAAAVICGAVWLLIVCQQWGLVSETLAASGHGASSLASLVPGVDGGGLSAALAVITIALSSLGGLILWELFGVSHVLPAQVAESNRRMVLGVVIGLLLVSVGIHVLVGSHRAEQICANQLAAAEAIGSGLTDPTPEQLAQANRTRQAEFEAAQVDCDFNSVFDPLIAGLSVVLEAIVSFALPLVLIGLACLLLLLARIPILAVALVIGLVLAILNAIFSLIGFLIRLVARRRGEDEGVAEPEAEPVAPVVDIGDTPIGEGGLFHGGPASNGSSSNGAAPPRDPDYAPWG